MAAELAQAEFIIDPTSGEILGIRAGGDSAYFNNTPGATGFNSDYTYAQLEAMESAGTLTEDTWYKASDTEATGLATAVNTMAWIDFDALALAMENGIATYAAGEIEKLAGIPNLAGLIAAAEVMPRPFVIAQSDGPTPPLVFAAITFIAAFTLSNPAGTTMRIVGAGVHGLGATADGKYLWIQTSAGVPSGFYEITDRATSTTWIEVDVTATYSSLIGSTTIDYVGRTNQAAHAVIAEIPGDVMGPNGMLQVDLWLRSSTSTANAKNYLVAYGTDADGENGTECANGSFSSAYAVQPPKPSAMVNQGAVDSQVLFAFSTTHTATPPTAAIDTDSPFYVSIRLRNGVVDEDVEILAWRITLTPGM